MVLHLVSTFGVFPLFSFDLGGYDGLVVNLDYFFMNNIIELKLWSNFFKKDGMTRTNQKHEEENHVVNFNLFCNNFI